MGKQLSDKEINSLIENSWKELQEKIINDAVTINKEASLQLQFAVVLQTKINSIKDKQIIKVLLEETIFIQNNKPQEADVVIETTINNEPYRIAIEMKCYRKLSASGKRRAAIPVFIRHVYEDLEVLEDYKKEHSDIKATYFLAMTDFEYLVNPDKRKAAYKQFYNMSSNYVLKAQKIDDGKKSVIKLENDYEFNWIHEDNGKYYFLMIRK